MTSHRRMIDNLCRQALDEGQAVTHREDLLAAEVRRLQAEVDATKAKITRIDDEMVGSWRGWIGPRSSPPPYVVDLIAILDGAS